MDDVSAAQGAPVPSWARWVDTGGVWRIELFLAPAPEPVNLRGCWTACDETELRAMLGWLQAAGIEVVPSGATEGARPRWPEGMGPT